MKVLRPKTRRWDEVTTASELAQMGVCECQVELCERLGERRTSEQEVAAREGTRAHERFHQDAMRSSRRVETSEPDRRCFIATAVFGEAEETRILREFRDRTLLVTWAGRLIVAAYYRVSPPLATYLNRNRFASRVVRNMLIPCVRVAAAHMRRRNAP